MRERRRGMGPRAEVVDSEDASVHRVRPHVTGEARDHHKRDDDGRHRGDGDEPDLQTSPALVGDEHAHISDAGDDHDRDVQWVG